jgi:hypothetical protein
VSKSVARRLKSGITKPCREAVREAQAGHPGAASYFGIQRIGRGARPKCSGNGPAGTLTGHLRLAAALSSSTKVGHDQQEPISAPLRSRIATLPGREGSYSRQEPSTEGAA